MTVKMAGCETAFHRLIALTLYLSVAILVFNVANAALEAFSSWSSDQSLAGWLDRFRSAMHLIPLFALLEVIPAAVLGWRLMRKPQPKLQHFILGGVLAAATPVLILLFTGVGAVLVLFILPAIPLAGTAGAVAAWCYLSLLGQLPGPTTAILP
jgi:hypothetical protein